MLMTIALLVSAPSGAADPAIQDADAYRIQPGDVLEISVWREEGLNKTVPVRPDGAISLPLVGELQASQRTVAELRGVIVDRLSKYIPSPEVTVMTMQLLGNRIYVIGKVINPGEFVLNRQIDVVQALSMAKGTTPYAAVNKIKVLRRENGKLRSIEFRYGDIEKGENLEQNIVLKSGDVVLVP